MARNKTYYFNNIARRRVPAAIKAARGWISGKITQENGIYYMGDKTFIQGAQSLTNGDFTDGSTGWTTNVTAPATVTFYDGYVEIYTAGTYANIYQANGYGRSIGWYIVEYEILSSTRNRGEYGLGLPRAFLNDNTVIPSWVGKHRLKVYVDSAHFQIKRILSGTYKITNIRVIPLTTGGSLQVTQSNLLQNYDSNYFGSNYILLSGRAAEWTPVSSIELEFEILMNNTVAAADYIVSHGTGTIRTMTWTGGAFRYIVMGITRLTTYYLVANTFYKIRCGYDGTNVFCYINDELIDSEAVTGVPASSTDEMALFNSGANTQGAQIALANVKITVDGVLKAHLPLSEGYGSTVKDLVTGQAYPLLNRTQSHSFTWGKSDVIYPYNFLHGAYLMQNALSYSDDLLNEIDAGGLYLSRTTLTMEADAGANLLTQNDSSGVAYLIFGLASDGSTYVSEYLKFSGWYRMQAKILVPSGSTVDMVSFQMLSMNDTQWLMRKDFYVSEAAEYQTVFCDFYVTAEQVAKSNFQCRVIYMDTAQTFATTNTLYVRDVCISPVSDALLEIEKTPYQLNRGYSFGALVPANQTARALNYLTYTGAPSKGNFTVSRGVVTENRLNDWHEYEQTLFNTGTGYFRWLRSAGFYSEGWHRAQIKVMRDFETLMYGVELGIYIGSPQVRTYYKSINLTRGKETEFFIDFYLTAAQAAVPVGMRIMVLGDNTQLGKTLLFKDFCITRLEDRAEYQPNYGDAYGTESEKYYPIGHNKTEACLRQLTEGLTDNKNFWYGQNLMTTGYSLHKDTETEFYPNGATIIGQFGHAIRIQTTEEWGGFNLLNGLITAGVNYYVEYTIKCIDNQGAAFRYRDESQALVSYTVENGVSRRMRLIVNSSFTMIQVIGSIAGQIFELSDVKISLASDTTPADVPAAAFHPRNSSQIFADVSGNIKNIVTYSGALSGEALEKALKYVRYNPEYYIQSFGDGYGATDIEIGQNTDIFIDGCITQLKSGQMLQGAFVSGQNTRKYSGVDTAALFRMAWGDNNNITGQAIDFLRHIWWEGKIYGGIDNTQFVNVNDLGAVWSGTNGTFRFFNIQTDSTYAMYFRLFRALIDHNLIVPTADGRLYNKTLNVYYPLTGDLFATNLILDYND